MSHAIYARQRLQLRTLGVMCMLAVVPLAMPFRRLDAAHHAMGLGSVPSAPIAEYLARSVSSHCAFYGGLLFLLARDVVRFAPVITYQAVAIMLPSAICIIAGICAGLPAFWVIIDAIGCWIFLRPIYFLSRRIVAFRPG